MTRMHMRLLVVAAVAVAAGCAVSEERSGLGAEGVPTVSGICAEDHPDCEDTVVAGDPPTGGNTPLAPSTGPGDTPQSSGLVTGDGLTIADAVAYEGTEIVAVHGYLIRTSQDALLCETLAESYPPQCGGMALTLTNPDVAADLVLLEGGDVQWSPNVVILLGHISGTDLTIDSTVNA